MSEQRLLGSHADDVVAIAKAAGFESSVEEVAKTLEELSDELLIAVSGGGVLGSIIGDRHHGVF